MLGWPAPVQQCWIRTSGCWCGGELHTEKCRSFGGGKGNFWVGRGKDRGQICPGREPGLAPPYPSSLLAQPMLHKAAWRSELSHWADWDVTWDKGKNSLSQRDLKLPPCLGWIQHRQCSLTTPAQVRTGRGCSALQFRKEDADFLQVYSQAT